jgi:hypothetical protein
MQAHYDLFVGIDVAATTFTATWCTATINAVLISDIVDNSEQPVRRMFHPFFQASSAHGSLLRPYSAKNLSAERS